MLIEELVKFSALVLFSTGALSQDFVEEETRLRRDLSANYSVRVRPQLQTHLNIIFGLTAINYVDMRQEEISLAGFFDLIWTDDRLKWSASKYSGIKVLQFDADQFWTPTGIVLYNSVGGTTSLFAETSNIPARVNPSGRVVWSHFNIFVVSCKMDITYFPFDVQVCSIYLADVGYNDVVRAFDRGFFGSGMNRYTIDLNFFRGNNEWTVVSSWTNFTEDSDGDNVYSVLAFSLMLRRKPLYYALNCLLPIVLVACLANMVFLLPAESGEKLNFSLMVLLTFIILLTFIVEHIPTSAEKVSLLQVFMAVVLSLCCFVTILSVFVLKVYYRDESKPPTGWLLALAVYHHNIKISLASRFRHKDSTDVPTASRQLNNNNEDRLEQNSREAESKLELPESAKRNSREAERKLELSESAKWNSRDAERKLELPEIAKWNSRETESKLKLSEIAKRNSRGAESKLKFSEIAKRNSRGAESKLIFPGGAKRNSQEAESGLEVLESAKRNSQKAESQLILLARAKRNSQEVEIGLELLESAKRNSQKAESKIILPGSAKQKIRDTESSATCLENGKSNKRLYANLNMRPQLRRNEMSNVIRGIKSNPSISSFSNSVKPDRVSWTMVSKALDSALFYVNFIILIITITVFAILFHWQDLIDF